MNINISKSKDKPSEFEKIAKSINPETDITRGLWIGIPGDCMRIAYGNDFTHDAFCKETSVPHIISHIKDDEYQLIIVGSHTNYRLKKPYNTRLSPEVITGIEFPKSSHSITITCICPRTVEEIEAKISDNKLICDIPFREVFRDEWGMYSKRSITFTFRCNETNPTVNFTGSFWNNYHGRFYCNYFLTKRLLFSIGDHCFCSGGNIIPKVRAEMSKKILEAQNAFRDMYLKPDSKE